MVVWFASGLSLADWLRPVARVAVPDCGAGGGAYAGRVALGLSPDRRVPRALRAAPDLSKVTAGQFAESGRGDRVFFAEDPVRPGDELGAVFARSIDPEWLSVLTASNARSETLPNGDRFLVLGEGHRYDLKPGTPEIRLVNF